MVNENKSALVVGATGLVGNELLKILLNKPDYKVVKIFTRRKLEIDHPNLVQIIVDFNQLDQYKEHMNVNDVYCCLGTTIKKAGSQKEFRKVDYEYPLQLAKLSSKCGVEKFLIITAMGADKNSKVFYNRVKGEVEEQLKILDLPNLQIFRPSLLLGNRQEFRLGEKLAIMISPLFSIALRGKWRKYKPIIAKDVATAMYTSGQKQVSGTYIYSSDQIWDISYGTP